MRINGQLSDDIPYDMFEERKRKHEDLIMIERKWWEKRRGYGRRNNKEA